MPALARRAPGKYPASEPLTRYRLPHALQSTGLSQGPFRQQGVATVPQWQQGPPVEPRIVSGYGSNTTRFRGADRSTASRKRRQAEARLIWRGLKICRRIGFLPVRAVCYVFLSLVYCRDMAQALSSTSLLPCQLPSQQWDGGSEGQICRRLKHPECLVMKVMEILGAVDGFKGVCL